MHPWLFAARNVLDKLHKVAKKPEVARFYLQTYVLSRLDRVVPDLYVVSYPKCGRTWVRVLLLEYTERQGHPSETFNDRGLLTLGGDLVVKFEHGQGNWVPAPPRIERLRFNRDKYAGKKVVFLVRDPRDVLVSSWYHLRSRENIYREDLSTFVRDPLVGVEKVVAFMNMWVEHADVPGDMLLLRYEELHEEPVAAFTRLLEFSGLEVDDAVLRAAIDASSFDSMRRMETSGSLREPWMQPGAKGLDDSLKVRKGRIGSFRDELSDEDIAFVDDVIARKLSPNLPYSTAE